MFCRKCGNLLSNEIKFCPNCGEKVLELNATITASVELRVTSNGVDNEIFSNMRFDIFVDDIHIGNVLGKGTTVYKITPGQHYIKIGIANIYINIPKEEVAVTLFFIWGSNIEQKIICQQGQFVTKFSEPETIISQTTSNRKKKILVLGLVSIVAVLVIVVLAVTINLEREDYALSMSERFSDRDSDENDTIIVIDIPDRSSVAIDDSGVQKAYAEKIRELTAQDNTYLFDLIDLDGNNVLELVADHPGYDVSVFTWVDGKIITLMEQWDYGAMGNLGYQYLPRHNVIYNYDMDNGGAVIYENYWAVNRYYEVASISGETLITCHFNDTNRNQMLDEDEEYSDEPFYYYGDTEITKKEYESYRFQGNYKLISGDKTSEEILKQLNAEN